MQPPSLYKYFDSLLDVYDALFRRGQAEHLDVMQAAMAGHRGLPALVLGLDASGLWCLNNQAITQLLFWRPVPSFEPSPESFAPSVAMVALQREALAEAVAEHQLGADADSDEALYVVSVLVVGVLTQAMANEPALPWGEGRFTSVFPRLMQLLPLLYPPA